MRHTGPPLARPVRPANWVRSSRPRQRAGRVWPLATRHNPGQPRDLRHPPPNDRPPATLALFPSRMGSFGATNRVAANAPCANGFVRRRSIGLEPMPWTRSRSRGTTSAAAPPVLPPSNTRPRIGGTLREWLRSAPQSRGRQRSQAPNGFVRHARSCVGCLFTCQRACASGRHSLGAQCGYGPPTGWRALYRRHSHNKRNKFARCSESVPSRSTARHAGV